MATKSIFSQMLNEAPIAAPQLKAPGVKVQKPPSTKEFAYLNSKGVRPLQDRGNDIAQSVWAHIANMKPKGVKNG